MPQLLRSRRSRIGHYGLIRLGVIAAMTAAAVISITPLSASAAAPVPVAAASSGAAKPVFAYYYLWWSKNHWIDMLGPHYPTKASTLPLPAVLGANGCSARSVYQGNELTDVPSRLSSQDDPGAIEADVRQAASAKLAGFAVNWLGNGSASQGASSTVYNRRLAAMVKAVHKVNAEGIPFKLWLSYRASATRLSTSWILGDLKYFMRTYGADPAFDHSTSHKPTIIWQGSRKYSVSVLQAVNRSIRPTARLIGDEYNWTRSRASFLDGDAYYWSSQDPWANQQSFGQLASLAASVRASGRNPDGSAKIWVAPVSPGYNKELSGGHNCVPRRNGATLRALFAGNNRTHPDAWGLISWNEVAEGTYVDPMRRYGASSLVSLKGAISSGF
jgi:hypothetical protein